MTHATCWAPDWPTAEATARAAGVPMLALFSGADWCKPCKRLHAEVTDTDAFAEWARGRVVPVLVEVGGRDGEARDGDDALQERFRVRGVPVAWFGHPDEAPRAWHSLDGYPDGAKAWYKAADKILGKL